MALVERTFSNFSFHMGSSEIRMTPSITWLGFKEAPQKLHFRRSKVSTFLCFGITMHWMGVINFCERQLSENCDSTLSSLTFISQVQTAVILLLVDSVKQRLGSIAKSVKIPCMFYLLFSQRLGALCNFANNTLHNTDCLKFIENSLVYFTTLCLTQRRSLT